MGNADSRFTKLDKMKKDLNDEKFKLLILDIIKELEDSSTKELIEKTKTKILELEDSINNQQALITKDHIEASIQHDDLMEDWY